MWVLSYFYILIFSFCVTLFTVRKSINIAKKFNIVDTPSNRKVHVSPTPLLGGLGIFSALVFTVIFNFALIIVLHKFSLDKNIPALSKIFLHVPGMLSVSNRIFGILAMGTLVFVLGLLDDKFGLNAKLKFVLEILIAFAVIYFFDIKITLFIKNNFLNYILTILWIVGITNSFNLLDNMDGLSAGVALICSFVFFLVATIAGQLFIGIFLIALIGTLTGFLYYNFHPAKIFMGDAGSLFIGFNLSLLTIMGTYYIKGSANLYPVLMPVLILGLPIYDTFSVIFIRIKNKESIFKADKNHFSHRMLRLGMPHAGVALFIYLVTFCVALNAILLPQLDELRVLIIFLQAIVMLSVIALMEYFGKKAGGDK